MTDNKSQITILRNALDRVHQKAYVPSAEEKTAILLEAFAYVLVITLEQEDRE